MTYSSTGGVAGLPSPQLMLSKNEKSSWVEPEVLIMSSLPNGSFPKGFHMLLVESNELGGRPSKSSSKFKSSVLSKTALLPMTGEVGGVLYAAETVRPETVRFF